MAQSDELRDTVGNEVDGSSKPVTASVPGPRCMHLRTKAMYIAEFAATAWTGGDGGSGSPDGEWDQGPPTPVCWCNQTLREVGPDGEPADPGPCSETLRVCYRRPPGL